MADDGTQLLEELMRFRPEGLTANAWAVKAGVSRTIWSDLRRHGNPSRRTLSKLLEAAGSSLAEFEALRAAPPPEATEPAGQLAESRRRWGHAPLTPLPLLSTERGGAWDHRHDGIELIAIDYDIVVDRLPRPATLAADRNAYALEMVVESMWPRFRRGRRLAVSPFEQVGIGDDVLVRLADGRGALIGELQSKTFDAFILRQFNPATEFQVSAAIVSAVHKVVGELF
jgi:phage repressor protein C with HTH and peptisase S24 domain